MRTKREIFEIVKAHLLAQGARAMRRRNPYDNDLSEECAYLGSDGKKCAVGCLIPDDLYSPTLEGSMVLGLDPKTGKPDSTGLSQSVAWAAVDEAVPELRAYHSMLVKLQKLHDETDVCNWPVGLDRIGIDEFGLDNQGVVG